MYVPNIALASSGGRGSSFASSSSSSSSSDSYSVPTRSQKFSYSAPFRRSSSSDSYLVPARSKEFSYSTPSSGEVYLRPTNRVEFHDFYTFLVLTFSVVYWSFYFFVLMMRGLVSMLKVSASILGFIVNKKYYCNKYLLVFLVLVFGYLFEYSPEEKTTVLKCQVYTKRSIDQDGEKRFDRLSIEKRGKFDEETLVNVNNIKKQSTRSYQRSNGFTNEYIVITISVAVKGKLKIPSINGSGNLKEALQKLGSIPWSKLLEVEVLRTRQNENDTLSEREFLEDYPLLRPL